MAGSEYILNVTLTRFPDGLDMRCKKNQKKVKSYKCLKIQTQIIGMVPQVEWVWRQEPKFSFRTS